MKNSSIDRAAVEPVADIRALNHDFKETGATRYCKCHVRVRSLNPDLHLDTDGKYMKYKSPNGAQCALYIPERIRQRYRESEHIDSLVIRNREKNACGITTTTENVGRILIQKSARSSRKR